jgi:hypothetical protein
MAATSHPLATLAAVDMLRAGGTAADAAVAAAALLGVIETQSTGVGGDAFALYVPNGADRVIAYNGSGKAPMRASAEWFLDRNIRTIPLIGAHSVTVPGTVDLWATLLLAHGRKGLDTALQPAIRAAAEGFSVAPRTAWDWTRNVEKLRTGLNTRPLFLHNDNAPRTGDTVRQPLLAETLRLIAARGRDGFYRGQVAEDIVAALRAEGGLHELADFADNATEIVKPMALSGVNQAGGVESESMTKFLRVHSSQADEEYINADLIERIGVRYDDDVPITAILRNGKSVRLDDSVDFDQIIPALPGYTALAYYADRLFSSPIVAWRWDRAQDIMWPIPLHSAAHEARSCNRRCYDAVKLPGGQVHARFMPTQREYASEAEWAAACRKAAVDDELRDLKIGMGKRPHSRAAGPPDRLGRAPEASRPRYGLHARNGEGIVAGCGGAHRRTPNPTLGTPQIC